MAVLGTDLLVVERGGVLYKATASELPGGSGDVVGPASATDNAVARFDGTTGKLVQDSSVIISDTGQVGIGGTPSFRLDIPATGAVAGNLGGVLIGANGTDVVGAVTSLRLQANGANFVSFTTNSVERGRFSAAGNLLIGTTTDASPLTVAGVIESTSGGFKFPDGTTQTTSATAGAGLTQPQVMARTLGC